MTENRSNLFLRLAETPEDIAAAQYLRYQVFVKELGGDGDLVDHYRQLERDRFDPHFDHLMLFDRDRPGDVRDQIVGVYRLLRSDQVPRIGRYYSEDEYDLTLLKQSGRMLMELGRSCLHPDYRGGMAMYRLWNGLAEYVTVHGVEVMFGTASFHGTDPAAFAQSLSYLHHHHMAPADLRVRAVDDSYVDMNLVPKEDLDRKEAMRAMPPLIKAYLRLGGCVGDGAFVDQEFNTTDVCLLMDTNHLNPRQREIYTRDRV